MSTETLKPLRFYPSLGLALWEMLHPMLHLTLFKVHFVAIFIIVAGSPDLTGTDAWTALSSYACFWFTLLYWFRRFTLNRGQLASFGATLWRKARRGGYFEGGNYSSSRGSSDMGTDPMTGLPYGMSSSVSDDSASNSWDSSSNWDAFDSTPAFTQWEPSVNIDGSPMCDGVDIHGNSYGVTSSNSWDD